MARVTDWCVILNPAGLPSVSVGVETSTPWVVGLGNGGFQFRWTMAQIRTLGIMLLMLGLGWGHPAWAGEWRPVTPAGLEQQFIDAESIQVMPGGTVQVRSLYLNQRKLPHQRTTYTTEYRCQTREFRDVEYDGEPGDLAWSSVDDDPLNAQTLDDVCAWAGQPSGADQSPPKN